MNSENNIVCAGVGSSAGVVAGVGVGSSASAGAGVGAGGSGVEKMPLSVVGRIMQKALPPNCKITNEAAMAVQSCLSEFIGFITSEANDHCHEYMRKTISPGDILYALNNLGFDSYVEPLTLYLNRYRQYQAERKAVGGEANAGVVHQSPPSTPIIHYSAPEPTLAEVVHQSSPPTPNMYYSAPEPALADVVHQSPPPTPIMYYSAPEPATQFAPLHRNLIDTYYRQARVPPAPVVYNGGLTVIPAYGPGGGNRFSGGYGGVPYNDIGASNIFPSGYGDAAFNTMMGVGNGFSGGYGGVPYSTMGARVSNIFPGGYASVPFNAMGTGNAFPGVFGGPLFNAMGVGYNVVPSGSADVPFSVMGATTPQVCRPRGSHFVIVNPQPTSPGGSGSTSYDGQHTRGNGSVASIHNICYSSGSSRGGGGGGGGYFHPRPFM